MVMKAKQIEVQVEHKYHVSWYIILYKFLLGFAEFASGITIAVFGKVMLHIYTTGILQELSEDPHDLLANLSQKFIPGLLTQNGLLVIYLLILGAAKMIGAVGLIYKQNWGVDLLVLLTILMFPFQAVQLIMHFSLLDLIYITAGIGIALYLIEFRPRAWVSKMVGGVIKILQR